MYRYRYKGVARNGLREATCCLCGGYGTMHRKQGFGTWFAQHIDPEACRQNLADAATKAAEDLKEREEALAKREAEVAAKEAALTAPI